MNPVNNVQSAGLKIFRQQGYSSRKYLISKDIALDYIQSAEILQYKNQSVRIFQ
jgi:hypothetical protein